MLQNARVKAFIVSELLRENQQVKLPGESVSPKSTGESVSPKFVSVPLSKSFIYVKRCLVNKTFSRSNLLHIVANSPKFTVRLLDFDLFA